MDIITYNDYYTQKVNSTYFEGRKTMSAFRILLVIFILFLPFDG